MPEQQLASGFLVGEYCIERKLGQGGMGTVYLAVQPVLNKRVAVKVLQTALSETAEYAQRFLDEARAAVQIGHRNIVDIFAFGRLPDGRLYYVMEFLEGRTLAERLQAQDLTPQELRRLLGEICEALGEAHRHQIVHRDLKPDNIWIAQPPRGLSYVKILDFGIAKIVRGTERLTITGTQIGTPQYMAPEQWRGRGVHHRTDLYSLGVILYQIFAGRLPFEATTTADLMLAHLMNPPRAPSAERPMPAGLERLILDCLAKDPAARPASAAEVAQRLERALATAGEASFGAAMVASNEAPAATCPAISAISQSGPVLSVAASRRPLVLVLVVAALAATGGLWLVGNRRLARLAAPAPMSPLRPMSVKADPPTTDARRLTDAATARSPSAPRPPAPLSSPRRRRSEVMTRLPPASAPTSDGRPAAAIPATQEAPPRMLSPAEEAGLVEKVQR